MRPEYSESDAARFWSHVDMSGDCWEWQSARMPDGYGILIMGSRKDGTRRTAYAHRLAYELVCGPIPEGLCVLHHCDNPPCCNPAHLWIGTRGDNNRDRDRKGRYKGWLVYNASR